MRRYKRKTADQQDKSLKRGLQIRKNNLSRMRQKKIHKAGICASFFICKLFENSSKKDVFQVLPSPNFCQQLEKIPLLKIGKGMVRVRSIFSTILCVLKNGNKKTRSLDKISKLRAFLPFQLLLIIGLFGCGSQIWTDDLRVMSSSNASEKSHATQSFSDFTYRFCRRDDDADVDLSSAMTKWGTHFPLFLEKCFYKHGKYFWMNSSCYLITASEKSDVSLHNAFKICPINPPHSKKPQIQLLFPQEHDIITITRSPVKLQKQAEVRTWNTNPCRLA